MVKFYAAQIIIGIGKLHERGIMHRDLKLENIMVDSNGYIKIIDYGLAKMLAGDQLATSYCGTPEYLAPEMIQLSGHDMTIDWWAVGILIYEMLIGVTPFFNKNRQVLMSKIKHSRVVFPDRRQYKISYSDEIVNLIAALLKKDKSQRLGAQNDAAEILAHPWFADLDIVALERFELPAPIIPNEAGRASEVNTKYFDAREGNSNLAETVIPRANMKEIKKHSDDFAAFDQRRK